MLGWQGVARACPLRQGRGRRSEKERVRMRMTEPMVRASSTQRKKRPLPSSVEILQ